MKPDGDLRPGDVLSLDLTLLDDNPFQPRTSMDPGKLTELAASIQQSELIQPIAVRPNGPGRYTIVAGHRRVAAFKQLLAGATTDAERRRYALIKAHLVRAVTDTELAIACYSENVARDGLTPFDEAASLARIRELGHFATAAQVANATGQAERRVRRLLIEFSENGTARMVSIIDILDDGLSSVYTFFDPDVPGASFGTYNILWQAAQCVALGLPNLYLGYWIAGSRKMAYKSRFRPIEGLLDDQRQRLQLSETTP